MSSRIRQAKMQEVVDLIQATLQEIKRAKERDAIFEEKKRLYLQLKDLNAQLTEVIIKLIIQRNRTLTERKIWGRAIFTFFIIIYLLPFYPQARDLYLRDFGNEFDENRPTRSNICISMKFRIPPLLLTTYTVPAIQPFYFTG